MAGLLINGNWKTQNEFADEDSGKFKREETQFRNWITPDGKAGPDNQVGLKAESGRYHLYVSLACPWAHRTLIFRHLKGLEDHIDVSIVSPLMLDHGWCFHGDFDGATKDKVYDEDCMFKIYLKAKKDYTGKVTVPVLWDKKNNSLVNNESADIIRIFNTAFNDITGNTDDYYPAKLKDEIDALNKDVYSNINNGVYKAGFATNQDEYEKQVENLFDSLENIERRLSDGREYLIGDQLTEADIRLFTTLVRFDAVYYTHFKCNITRLSDFKWIQMYLERLYEMDAIKPTVNMAHIKNHYFRSHPSINPHGIVPKGPYLHWL